ncbi:MAG: serine/threonine protein kinase [Caldilineae bacterium]|nr:MAG: serine/threonine protein kinase [Caldilineae bacterium]
MQVYQVDESSQVGMVRREVARLCRSLGFDESLTGKATLIATELGTNLVKHGGGGEVILNVLHRDEAAGLELLSLDKGPGIEDPGRALRNGFSTAGSLGGGLGSVRRLASEFDMYTRTGMGTGVLARLWKGDGAGARDGLCKVGAVNLPLKGEERCGDTWAVYQTGSRCVVMVVDGLGHGDAAGEVAARARVCFAANHEEDPVRLLQALHEALRGTRGAAVLVAETLPGRREIRYAGVGNVEGRVLEGTQGQRLVSRNGIVGFQMPRVQEMSTRWPPRGMLIMHSDGVGGRWDPSDYPGLVSRHPTLIAGILYRDHQRVRDDSTVVVVKDRGP